MLRTVLAAQRSELTEHHIYSALAERCKDAHNAKVLRRIARDEKRHHDYWARITNTEVQPMLWRIIFYAFIARTFGLNFGLRLMERGEDFAQQAYAELKTRFKGLDRIIVDEQRHERELLDLLGEERLEYASSIVLGLNDALVELSGALAGLTFALRDARLIAVSGLIIGFAASLSMAASEFLSSREERGDRKHPLKAALYTGTAYILTVIILILPYLLLPNVYFSLATMLAAVLVIIAAYTFYITTAKSQRFLPRFVEMAAISLGVAIISYGFGYLVRQVLGIDV